MELFFPLKPNGLNCLWEAILIHLGEGFIYQMPGLETAD